MTDLIKTVRGIDHTGPGKNGEGLQRLWSCLAASSGRHFHAAEGSTLRWLLKSMNGTSAAAETVRRYPLTWTILACVFQRVPLFSLAKSLADRKFITVLQKTFKDISKPVTGSSSPASSKRKRNPPVGYDLNQLQDRQGCLETATELFKALQLLLGRLESPEAAFSRHQMGAEHIKSLFCTSAAEAVKIVAPALTVCDDLLISEPCDDSRGYESWISIVSLVWDLHLQGNDDAVEVANHLFPSSAIILARVSNFASNMEANISDFLRNRWSADLRLFMHQNLIGPGRRDFTRHKVLEPFLRALGASKNIIQVAAPTLYLLCTDGPGPISEGELRKEDVEWLRRIFNAVEHAIAEQPDRSHIIQIVLDRAARRPTSVDVDDLRRVCRRFALHESGTDWPLVAKVIACDSDVLLVSEEGHALRADICDRILKTGSGSAHDCVIPTVIRVIMEGFRTRRALPSFLQFWFEQLCQEERQRDGQSLRWSTVGHLLNSTQPPSPILETELSPTQLLGIISWVETQATELHPQSICIFASTIALALRSESFVDAVGQRLLDLVASVDGSKPASALKWRVVSQTMNWAPPSERIHMWNSVKKQLTKTLKKSPVVSSVTFEAFKCCLQAWDCMSLAAQADEPALLLENFSARLVAHDLGALVVDDKLKLPFTEKSTNGDFSEDCALQHYLMWCTYGSSRFIRLQFARNGDLPPVLSNALSIQDAPVEQVEMLWDAMLRNEINLNDIQLATTFVDRLVVALDGAVKVKSTGPEDQSLTWIKLLANIPIEVFSRGQREKLMNIINKQRATMAQSDQASLHAWKMVLSFATKMMRRPTFYLDMSFSDLVELATAISGISIDCSSGCETTLELIERFLSMASATIRQMADHLDERGVNYFRGASEFVSDCKTRLLTVANASTAEFGLFITLLRALVGEFSRTPNLRSHEELASLAVDSKAVLQRCVAATMSKFISDKKLPSASSSAADMSLLSALDAASMFGSFGELLEPKSSAVQKFDKYTKQQMQQGDLRAWKIQAFLQAYLPATMALSRPTTYDSLADLPVRLQHSLLKELVTSITGHMDCRERRHYLGELIGELGKGWDTDGQILAIQTVVDQLTDSFDQHEKTDGFSLAGAHSELTLSLLLLPKSPQAMRICHALQTLLESRPQAMGQWNIEITLSAVCDLSSMSSDESAVPFASLCKLVETVIKRHRLRLEGHYHVLLSALQALLRDLIIRQSTGSDYGNGPEPKAQAYSRLISLICEPTTGAVSRTQLHGALESATDAAKRSAGRHMYLIMMQYVKLQLQTSVPKAVSGALEPAMNAIFDITPPEVRKILNDAVQGGGRAILREMFRRYVKFGKWSGV